MGSGRIWIGPVGQFEESRKRAKEGVGGCEAEIAVLPQTGTVTFIIRRLAQAH